MHLTASILFFQEKDLVLSTDIWYHNSFSAEYLLHFGIKDSDQGELPDIWLSSNLKLIDLSCVICNFRHGYFWWFTKCKLFFCIDCQPMAFKEKYKLFNIFFATCWEHDSHLHQNISLCRLHIVSIYIDWRCSASYYLHKYWNEVVLIRSLEEHLDIIRSN